MKSPCTKVCVMDADRRFCLGCRRTLAEIAGWSEMTDAEHTAVLTQLQARQSDVAEVSVPPLA